MDEFQIQSEAGAGAILTMTKRLPRRVRAPGPQEFARISAELAKQAPQGLLEELQQQNQELVNALQELRDRQAELAQIHSLELDETNRGVVALYAELDENTKTLKRLSDLKSRFLSEMSHEFRSPLNSIRSLTGFLLARVDGDLTAEQEKQVQLIRKSAGGLAALVDDLLDLAKVEAGKATVRLSTFEVEDVFESLQGTIRPIIEASAVRLIFEECSGLPPLQTDESKLNQVLRNFLSNAVKFTPRGEIRTAARPGPNDTIVFSVQDSGIGIAEKDLPRVFEEFGQLENPLQAGLKGTGIGLSLARKLAELLGGSVSVQSRIGVGSTFFVTIPRVYRPHDDHDTPSEGTTGPGPGSQQSSPVRVLIVDDHEEDRYLIKGLLAACGRFEILEAQDGNEALRRAHHDRPHLIVLDLGLPDVSGFQVLDRLKVDEAIRDIPVIVNTSKRLDPSERRQLDGRAIAVLDKAVGSREEARARLRDSLGKAGLDPSSPISGAP
jgi:signal transduction histidine kinase